ncbi:TPA: DUF4209 domain-containing protein [Klebsiella pneumoniae]|uniref:DUF4209 domain-containing protein n=4 Tax=Klebsiella pneumoniae TaxID=573 RepID=A0A486RLU1_KLEPN|nr:MULTISPECIES: DUF4209 domain-containing protein [Klebsiella]AXS03443.1 DUF4209 domain-containing protein [Klebsiella pneumoniae]EIV7934916.1 DUF4209 domain-containing protein [Klebsiella pneumoniae]EIW9361608.1 DUF4209 domain-containing protein [Klebsiella pneumoniae]EIW9589476.1 DUF4209 domain-containing protein [Klebsiella pneumoniae]EIX9300521.1 DUF4209 domain-containing protein [Klebsiella pneumoniae]
MAIKQDDTQPKSDMATMPVVLAVADDFAVFNFDSLLPESASCDYHELNNQLEASARSSDETQKSVYELFKAICSFHFRADDPVQPWGPVWSGPNGRSYIPSDFRGEQNDILSNVVIKIENRLLRARVADIIWTNDKRKKDAATIAINTYCELIDTYSNRSLQEGNYNTFNHMGKLEQFLRRVFDIASLTQKKNSFPKNIQSAFDVVYAKALELKLYIVFERVARLGANKKIIDWSVVAKDAKRLASKTDANTNPDVVKKVLYLAASAFEKNGDNDSKRECQENAVEQTLKMREHVSQASAKAYWTSIAIGELRSVGGHKERIAALIAELRDFQMSSRDEFATFTIPIDADKEREETSKIYSELSLSACLHEFALAPYIISKSDLRHHADTVRKESFFSNFMGGVHTDIEGKVYAKTPAVSVDGNPSDEWYKSRHIRTLDLFYHHFASGFVDPVRYCLSTRFSIEERHFESISALSSFVPGGHEHIFSLGFSRFFQGDYASASYLLIPQLENSIRFYMHTLNRETSKLDNELLQEDRSLSGMLESLRPELEQVFGGDLINIIDLLFNYKPGPSLRHEIAHGKLSAGGCFSASAIYACWLIYRLVCWPLLDCWVEYIAPSIEEN